MSWLKISNPGNFDVVNAVNMLGASVKVNNNPIGMFGSGTKYALAQLVRSGIAAKIFDGEKMYTVGTSKKTLRDREFDMVTLNTVGKKNVTPITVEFGAKDWNDTWFIFRELYSNALDEKNHSMEVVDTPHNTPGHTSVFLPYKPFEEYHKNIEKYFTNMPNFSMWAGDGSCYKQNVFCGQLKGTTLSMNNSGISLNECRVMDTHNILQLMSIHIRSCDIKDVWVAFFKSEKDFINQMEFRVFAPRAANAIHEALLEVYGPNYCLCPDVNNIVRDAQSMGMVPVVLPSTIEISVGNVRDYLKMENTSVVRRMTEDEKKKYDTVRQKISAFVSTDIELDVKVFTEGIEQIRGTATIGTNRIDLRDTTFNDEHDLMHVIIHEIGHIVTKAGDYDRRFTSFFVDCLVNLAK